MNRATFTAIRAAFVALLFSTAPQHVLACYVATFSSFSSTYNDGFGALCYTNGQQTDSLKNYATSELGSAVGYGDTSAGAAQEFLAQATSMTCDNPSGVPFTLNPYASGTAVVYKDSPTSPYELGMVTTNITQNAEACPPPPVEDCPEGQIRDPDTQMCRFNCSLVAGTTQSAWVPYDNYTTGGGLNGCGGSVDYSVPVTSSNFACDLSGTNCWVQTNYSYNGEFVPSSTYDMIADPNRMQDNLSAIETTTPQTTPTYTNSTSTISSNTETLPDGTTVTTTVTQEITQEDSWIRNEATGDTLIIEDAGGDKTVDTTTTIETVAPDGSSTITTSTERIVTTVNGDTYIITDNGSGVTITNVAGTTSTATTSNTTTSTTKDATGNVTGETTTTDQPPEGPEQLPAVPTLEGALNGMDDLKTALTDNLGTTDTDSLKLNISWWSFGTGTCVGFPYDVGRLGSGTFDQHCAFYDDYLRPTLEWLIYAWTLYTLWGIWLSATRGSD